MDRSSFCRAAASLLAWAACFLAPVAGQAQAVPSIRRVQVLHTRDAVEIQIEASDRVVPQTNVLSNPSRLIVDFVRAVPGAQLRSQAINREEVKSVRVGLFSSDPPVTRIVLDLNGPQAYQVFPSGRTVIVKVGGSGGAQTAAFRPASSGAVLVNSNYPVQAVPIAAPVTPRLEVSFQGGQLSIRANKAALSEVLFAVHERTGAEIAIPAGAEQEQVVGEFGPASAPEVLSRLLNGSRFNFLILDSASNPGTLDRVILSQRPEGPATFYSSQSQPAPLPQVENEAEEQVNAAPPPVVQGPDSRNDRAVPKPPPPDNDGTN
jgi:AMIN domain-containing protein